MDEILLQDPELARAIILESDRQVSKLELIASENFVSPAVREAQGSVLTHKYAEGIPASAITAAAIRGHRRNPGPGPGQAALRLRLRQRAAPFRFPANMAAYFACLKPGDVILGMNLSHGGHLTHAAR